MADARPYCIMSRNCRWFLKNYCESELSKLHGYHACLGERAADDAKKRFFMLLARFLSFEATFAIIKGSMLKLNMP